MLITQCKILYRPAHLSWSRIKVYKISEAKKKTGQISWNLIEKGPKFTVSAILHPQIFFVS